jgi:hypothetical protein
VGTSDYVALRLAFGATAGHPGYELRKDAEGDGTIGGSEITLMGGLWGGPPGPSDLACAGTPPCDPPPP